MNSAGMPDAKAVISDTSCLIILQKIAALEILRKLYPQTIATPEVQREFGAEFPDWITIQPVKDTALSDAFKESVDTGEASAIALAIETPNSLLIVDDLKGRNLAKRMGIDFMGTLGMLLKAKEHGIITAISPYAKKYSEQTSGFRRPLSTTFLNKPEKVRLVVDFGLLFLKILAGCGVDIYTIFQGKCMSTWAR